MTAVDWTAFQKCPVCPALLGEPCLALSGFVASEAVWVEEPAATPHTGRKPRAGR